MTDLPITLTTIPLDFRSEYGAPCYNETARLVHESAQCQYINPNSLFNLSTHDAADLIEGMVAPYQPSIPLISYENMYRHEFRGRIGEIKSQLSRPLIILHITEDLHLSSSEDTRQSLLQSDYTLAKFPLQHQLYPSTKSRRVIYFPQFCAPSFLGEPACQMQPFKLFHYGNLNCPDNMVDTEVTGSLNYYQHRSQWHRLLSQATEFYGYQNFRLDDLETIKQEFNACFACTYYPHRFDAAIIDLHGSDWQKQFAPERPGVVGYPLAKFFEVPGMGFLMVADGFGIMDLLSENGFEDGVNFIHINLADYRDKLKYLADASLADERQRICERGNRLIHERHSFEARKQQLRGLIEAALAEVSQKQA
jgi:hypothetical protein